jgi:pyridoxal phosphate enzyme (YggS family)
VEIGEKIGGIRERIARAAERAGRDPAAVLLIGAVKGASPTLIGEAIEAGLRDLGENFVQEAERHQEALSAGSGATWHLIGHLQTNKAADAAHLFATIQSVDSIRLARHLNERASVRLKVLLEVNVAGEASKFGLAPGEVAKTVAAAGALEHLDVAGLMTIAPAVADPEQVRPVFRELRELAAANGLRELSMGMTDDFEVAVEEGATMVRIGRAIFGERR